jgi:hypothetical protein
MWWLNPSERKVAPEMQMKTWRANSNPQTDILCEQYNVPLYTHPQNEIIQQQEQTIERYHNMLRDKDVNIEYLREKLIASIDDIKTLKCQQMTINFRQTHWEQLLSYIEDAEKIGCFYGNR